jgi:FMN phosphatase YigB (HAD superfamily)
MPRFSLFIFDLDNTLYDWYSAFLPAFYEMVRVASELLSCSQEQILTELQHVHIKHHDVEHPFSLMETNTVQELIAAEGPDALWQKLDPAFHAFNRVRKEKLQLFPHVAGTLAALQAKGSRLVAYTDSTYFSALLRVERLGLAETFAQVYCRERGKSLSRSTSPPIARPNVVEIPSHESKPNPRVLQDIIHKQGVPISRVAYVGDSLSKDVLMAKRAGCFAVWAKYGVHTDREMYASLIRISHWTPEDIQREKDYAFQAKGVVPDFICERSIQEVMALA